MTDHAKFSFSATARWLECPASARIAATMIKELDGEESKKGTAVHARMEDALRNGRSFADVDPDSDDDYEALRLATHFVQQLGPGAVDIEQKVSYKDIPGTGGTADVIHIPGSSEFVFTVIDYKNGAIDVRAYENKQMLSYAGAYVDGLKDGVTWRTHARLVIIQPNSWMTENQPFRQEPDGTWSSTSNGVKQWIVPIERLYVHKAQVADAVKRADEAPRPGEHCRYCPAFGKCDATRETLPFLVQSLQLPAHVIPDEAIINLLRILRGIDDYRDGLQEEALKRVAAGRKLPGGDLGVTAARRVWADEAQAIRQLFAAYDILGLSPVSPASAEKLGPIGKQIAAQLSRKPTGTPKLVY